MRILPIERRWMHAVLDSMFPRGATPELPIGVLDLDVDPFLDDMLTSQSLVGALGLRACFAFVACSPAFTLGKPTTLDKLPSEQRERALGRLYGSRFYLVRQLVVLAKATGAMLYCSAPESRRVMLDEQPSTSSPKETTDEPV